MSPACSIFAWVWMVLTSTQVDEDAQHFYRKLGYKDCGRLTVDVPGYEQPMEISETVVKQFFSSFEGFIKVCFAFFFLYRRNVFP